MKFYILGQFVGRENFFRANLFGLRLCLLLQSVILESFQRKLFPRPAIPAEAKWRRKSSDFFYYQSNIRIFYHKILKNKMKKQVALGLLSAVALAGEAGKYQTKEFDPVQLPSYEKADLNTLYASTTNTEATNHNQFGVINDAENSADATSLRSIDALFSRVPSSLELDELINSADSVGLLKTIQSLVSNDSIPCGQTINYLLELLGRVRAAIQKKQFGANQLKVIIDGARVEIARLNKLIGGLQGDIKDLWLDELHEKLAGLISDLEDYYQQFNFVESQIAPNEAKVAGYQKEVELLTKSSDEERNRIANDKLKLTAAESLIQDLKRRIAAAEENKAYIEASIKASLETIARNDQGIEEAEAKIKELEAEIRKLRDQLDALRAKTLNLEIQVERLRTDITVAETKEQRLEQEIEKLRDRVNIEEKKLADGELHDLNRQIGVLKDTLPGIEEEVNRQYYYCFGDGAVQVEETGSTVVYIVKGENFQGLLEKTYGLDFSDFACCDKEEVKAHKEYKFESIDIFSQPYVEEIGYPFPEEKKKPYADHKSTKFDNDFNCLNNDGASGRGVIVACDGNKYTVRRYATAGPPQDDFVEVGACTVIMSTVKVPRPGMNIAYTGHTDSSVFQAGMITVW